MTVISFIQAREILKAIDEGKTRLRLPLDLGLQSGTVDINPRFKEVKFSDAKVTFSDLAKIADDTAICYFLEKRREPQKLKLFSAETNRFYKLVPTTDAPTVEISGIRMHRTQERTPWQDTLDKISSIAPLKGRVLDTCCCLGYTAIAAAKNDAVTQLFTFENDSNVLEMTDYNPWSRELYLNRKIKLTIGDVYRGVEMFSAAFFDAVIHDPPRFPLAPELYSLDFYKKLHRVLKSGGRIFHYTGNPGEKQGKNFVKGVLKRLREAGFGSVNARPDVLGVTARK
ncbi:methyltransferase [Candidatus Woesearchaeota archaeon]|nr:methyltransferase [Candidatus Woesearchaeota archaeon]